MSAFKVGDRVRVIACKADGEGAIGMEGVILRAGKRRDWIIHIPSALHAPTNLGVDMWAFDSDCLAPLTPPAADAWATEAVKRVTKPIHAEPVVQVKPARIEMHYSFAPLPLPTYIDTDGIIRFGNRPGRKA